MSGLKHSYRSINGYKARLIERIRNHDPNVGDELRHIKLDWYAIKNTTDGDSDTKDAVPQILIYEEIGGSFGIDAATFVSELNDIDAEQIDIRINSPGGSVFDAIAIYNAIVRHPAHITTYVDALAASAASIIAMAGDEVVMMVGSQMMIHDALGGEMGNAKDFREMADFLDKQSDNLASIYAVKGGEDTKYWRDLMLAETWMMAGEAVELKLADRIYSRPVDEPDDEPTTDGSDVEPPDVSDVEEDDSTVGAEADIEAAMQKRHRLTNRGFKYTGRERAPDPLTVVNGWKTSNPIRSLADLISKW